MTVAAEVARDCRSAACACKLDDAAVSSDPESLNSCSTSDMFKYTSADAVEPDCMVFCGETVGFEERTGRCSAESDES